MSYTIIISKSVQKQIDDLPNDVRERVDEKIQNLADEPRPNGVVKLQQISTGVRYKNYPPLSPQGIGGMKGGCTPFRCKAL